MVVVMMMMALGGGRCRQHAQPEKKTRTHARNTCNTRAHAKRTHVFEHRHVAARVGEAHVAKLDRAAGERERLGVGRVGDLAARVEQLQQVLFVVGGWVGVVVGALRVSGVE